MDSPASARYGTGSALEIVQIERELQRLWKDAAESSTKSGGGPVVRACSMTLVAPCSNDLQFDHVAQVVEQTAFRQPCRAILVKVDLENDNSELEASVSTVCALGGPQQKRVCHEQIQFFASAGALANVSPAILGLLVPDVPAWLWTPCEKLLVTPMVEELSNSCDAILLDSHRFSEPFHALDRAISIARDHRANRALEFAGTTSTAGTGFGVVDLEWVRLQIYFDATASAFENPAARPILNDIQSLRIEYASHGPGSGEESHTVNLTNPRARITPALYAAWFASRLGWEMDGSHARDVGATTEMRFASRGATRRVTLVPRQDNERAGALLGIEIASTAGRVRIERHAGEEIGNIIIEPSRGRVGAKLQYRFVQFDDTEALSRALMRAPRDIAYEKVIPVAMAFSPR